MTQNTQQNVRTREAFSGYLFHNPDTGTEWNISHPVESGECEDATDIQHATFPRLISHLQEAWSALEGSESERKREIQEAEARGAAEQRRKDAEGSLRPMSEAKKDRTPILAKIHDDLFPRIRPKREDLKPWNGRWVVVSHPGILADGFDIGWGVAAPVGWGGIADDWFVGWKPLEYSANASSLERRFQHVKRGTEYRLIGRGKLQQNGPYDMAEVVIYQDVNDGSFWVRSPSEFYDGRFKEIFGAGTEAQGAEEARRMDAEACGRWEFEEPEYHAQGMGCGLEDQGIHDRYAAMEYGWDQAVERCIERIPEELYTHPANVAALEARVKVLEAEKIHEFNRGYVIACCNTSNLHNEPTIACDVLAELDISEDDIQRMDLAEYDATALAEIRKQRKEDPVRAALTREGGA